MGRAIDTDRTMYEYVADGLSDFSDDKTVIYFKGSRISKARVRRECNKFCSFLLSLGIGRGDVVTIHLPNLPAATAAFYAVNKLGAIANLIHPLMPPLPLSEMTADAGSKLLLTFDGYFAQNKAQLQPGCPVVTASASDHLPPLVAGIYRRTSEPRVTGATPWRAIMKKFPEHTGAPVGKGEDTAVFMHSGGTTGKPKTIKLSHKAFNELTECLTYVIADYDGNRDVSLMVLPIFHGFGLGVCMHSMLSRGIESVMIPKYSTKEVLSVIKKRGVTIIAGVPLMYKKMLGGGEAFAAMKGVKHIFCGGDKLTSSLKNQFDVALKKAGSSACLLEGYGQTECVTVCCVNEPGEYIKGCMGKPLHGIKIACTDGEKLLPPGQEGELVVCAPTLMQGYRDGDNDRVFMNIGGEKWLKTGDSGRVDEQGRVYFFDRIKAAEKVSGVVVYPQEICEVAGDVSAVAESYAVKVSRGDREYMRLYCALEKGADRQRAEEAIRAACEQKLIVYARPREIIFVDKLPRTAVGKVDVGKLKEESSARK